MNFPLQEPSPVSRPEFNLSISQFDMRQSLDKALIRNRVFQNGTKNRLQESFWTLFLRHMPAIGDNHQSSRRQLISQADALFSRYDPVIISGDHQHRQVQLIQAFL